MSDPAEDTMAWLFTALRLETKTLSTAYNACMSLTCPCGTVSPLTPASREAGLLSDQTFCCCSGTRLCPTLCDPMNRSMPGLSVHHQLPEPTQTHVHWVCDAIQPSHPLSPLLLLPSIFPSIGVFSNESALRVWWPKYWSFSFSISPSNEHPGLISFRMDWLDLLTVQGTLESSPTSQFKSINSLVLSFL